MFEQILRNRKRLFALLPAESQTTFQASLKNPDSGTKPNYQNCFVLATATKP